MNVRGLSRYSAAIAAGIVLTAAALLVAYDGTTSRVDQGYSYEKSLLLGTQAERLSHPFDVTRNGLLSIGYSNETFLRESDAEWRLAVHSIQHLGANSRDAQLSVIIDGESLHSNVANASIDVLLDDHLLRHVVLGDIAQTSIREYRPTDLPVQSIELSPLDQRAGYVFPATLDQLDRGDFAFVKVRTKGFAGVDVRTIGLLLKYRPQVAPLFAASFVTYGLAGLVGLLFTLALAFATRVIGASLGAFAAGWTVLALGLLTLATRDGWDLPLWVGLSNLVTFGGDSPMFRWTATPLWAFVPGIVSPVVALLYQTTGYTSAFATGLFVKLMLYAAYLGVAALLALLTPARGASNRRPTVVLIALLSPLSVAVLAWGARDVVAGAFALGSLLLTERRRFTVAQLLAVGAFSIDEYFLPLALVVPAVLLLEKRTIGRGLAACAYLAGAAALFVGQWALLPSVYRNDVITFRMNYTFGAATWQQMLASLHALSGALAGAEWPLFLIIYGALGAALFLGLVRVVQRGQSGGRNALDAVLPYVTAMTSVFFVSYGRVDPQEWYGLLALYLAGCARRLLDPLPVVLFAASTGMVMYAHFGLHEMLNPALLQPADIGIFPVRGTAEAPLLFLALASLVLCSVRVLVGRRFPIVSRLTLPVAIVWLATLLALNARTFIISDSLAIAGYLAATVAFCLELQSSAFLRTGKAPLAETIGAVLGRWRATLLSRAGPSNSFPVGVFDFVLLLAVVIALGARVAG